MASLCHPWFTTTNLSYRFPISETSATACGKLLHTASIYADKFFRRTQHILTQSRLLHREALTPSKLLQTESVSHTASLYTQSAFTPRKKTSAKLETIYQQIASTTLMRPNQCVTILRFKRGSHDANSHSSEALGRIRYNVFCSIKRSTRMYWRTWQHTKTTIMQAYQRDQQPGSPIHAKYGEHRNTPKATKNHSYSAATKNTQNERSRTCCTNELLLPAAAALLEKTMFCSFCSTQCQWNLSAVIAMGFAASRDKRACTHARSKMRQGKTTTTMRAFQWDLQPKKSTRAKYCEHAYTLKATSSHSHSAAKKNTEGAAPFAHKRPFMARCSHLTWKHSVLRSPNTSPTQPFCSHGNGFCNIKWRARMSYLTRENTAFRAPAFSSTLVPCSFPVGITVAFAASRGKPACIYSSTRWQQSCRHSNAISNQKF